jgi:hypothetical protein
MFELCTSKTWTTTSHSHDNNSLFLLQLSHSFKGVLMECFSRMKLVFKQHYRYCKNSLVRHEPAAFCKTEFSSSIFETRFCMLEQLLYSQVYCRCARTGRKKVFGSKKERKEQENVQNCNMRNFMICVYQIYIFFNNLNLFKFCFLMFRYHYTNHILQYTSSSHA